MTPAPKMSTAAPYRWVPSVVLDPKDVEDLLNALPPDVDLSTQLRQTSQAAGDLAYRLNQIDHGRSA